MKLMASLLHLESLNRLKFIKVDSASSYNFLIVFVLQKYKILRPYTNAVSLIDCAFARLGGYIYIYWRWGKIRWIQIDRQTFGRRRRAQNFLIKFQSRTAVRMLFTCVKTGPFPWTEIVCGGAVKYTGKYSCLRFNRDRA